MEPLHIPTLFLGIAEIDCVNIAVEIAKVAAIGVWRSSCIAFAVATALGLVGTAACRYGSASFPPKHGPGEKK